MDKTFLIDRNVIKYSDLDRYLNNEKLDIELSNVELGILSFIKSFRDNEIEFETSGTTGEPKKINHTYHSLTRNIKVDDKLKDCIWGLSYDFNKIAGSQVILQSYLNNATIVNLFGKSKKETTEGFNTITHISGTPTFYRLLMDGGVKFERVVQLTLGGEPSDEELFNKLRLSFPNCKITNIYASTEFGTLFSSNNEYFKITEKNSTFVKIINDEIVVHHSIVLQNINDEWYYTGDKVEWVDDVHFKIIGRESNMINVGGVKVNPIKVENKINKLDYVNSSYVYGVKNSLMGHIVSTDIVLKHDKTIKEIKMDLKSILNSYEVPMKINLVDKLETNTTGKIIRK
jgi:acyl-coenzyme A synthetase/AMP-(fatty) acid ligase